MTLEERLEKAEQELAAIRNEMTPKQEDRLVPQFEKRYWYVDSRGLELTDIWLNDEDDHYRLAIGNCGRTKEDARRYKASLFVKAPTGPMPKDGDVLMIYFTSDSVEHWEPNRHRTAIRCWNMGEACVKGYEQELEAKWKRYGWSVTGEPEPEGWSE